MTSDLIRNKLEDEEDGLFSYSYPSINLFDVIDDEVDFFIQTKGSVTDQQLDTINYVIQNAESIEEAVFPNLELMLATFLGMQENDIDLDKVEFSQIFIPATGLKRFVLCFESLYDDHGYQVLMEESKIIDKGKEFSY